jgi:hypothetical protein
MNSLTRPGLEKTSEPADFANPSTPTFEALSRRRRHIAELDQLSVFMDSLIVTGVDRSQLFSLHGIAAKHRFLDSRLRATQIAQDSATRFPSFAVACYQQIANAPEAN